MTSDNGWTNISKAPSPITAPSSPPELKGAKSGDDSQTPSSQLLVPPSKTLSDINKTPKFSPTFDLNHLSPEPVKHKEFYFSDGNALLRAGDVVFRVHWPILARHSKEFEKMSTEVNLTPKALVLAMPTDFARLLTVLYHPLSSNQKEWTVDDWTSVINQAQRWGMQAIKNYAAQELNLLPMSPVAKILLWRRFDLDPQQLIPSYIALCTAADPLSVDVLMKVGPETFVLLVKAREELKEAAVGRCCQCASKNDLQFGLPEKVVRAILFPRPEAVKKLKSETSA
ncbi:hypothetical protein BJ138DRAFT_1155470 [Hygrophoropsis aurantiaca]|uniref:Uncharacterized protein n=1 Tax=Hygrophoropsis aurantiaca TaxID=72124 RepID=A0ACB8A8H0_9AGAM|nr:hypothetical protein BJ138DRAFT_1155470 [Hygrophoropsis aurantiaca]